VNRVDKILLVDEDVKLRASLRSMLEDCPSMRIIGEASTIDEALSRMKVLDPSVVILDINFPVLAGIAATRLIKTRYPHVVVIGLSTNAADFLMHAMIKAGGDGLLQKEKATDDLVPILRKRLNQEKLGHPGII
jgi:DNA-binding NarL/FixJ family response regulator